MPNPLAGLTLVFCLGIILAGLFKIPLAIICLFSAVFLAMSLFLIKRKSAFSLVLFGLVFSLGALSLRSSYILPRNHISRYITYQGDNFYAVEGFVNSQPNAVNNKTSFIFNCLKLQSNRYKISCSGNILVYLKGASSFSYGQRLILKGELSRPYKFGNNQRQNYRDYLYNQGIFALMRVRSPGEVMVLPGERGWDIKKISFMMKDKIEAVIFKYTPALAASIIDAMILGEKKNIPPLISDAMIKAGTVHILVVSGSNVGIVTLVLVLFFKLWRVPRNLRIFFVVPIIIIYCLMTGSSSPVVRATIMAVFFILAFLLKREPNIYNALALAVLFILLINPRQLFDIGFQLSFASVFSIVYLYPKIAAFCRVEGLSPKMLKFLVEGCLVSFSAWVGTLGIIAYNCRIFSPVTVLANILIVPLATFITLSGFSLVFFGFVFSPLAPFLACSTEYAVYLLIWLNLALIKLPGAYFRL